MKEKFNLQKVLDCILSWEFCDIEESWDNIIDTCNQDLGYSEELMNQHKDEIISKQNYIDEEWDYMNIEEELGDKLQNLNYSKEDIIKFINRFYDKQY